MSQAIDALAKLDVIEPLTLAYHQGISGGAWVRIEFLRDGGWSGYEVEQYLKKFHVPIHGRGFTFPTEQYPGGTLFCYVKSKQASWAEYLLLRERVPLVSVFDPRNAAWAAGKGPVPAWADRKMRQRKNRKRRTQVVKHILRL